MSDQEILKQIEALEREIGEKRSKLGQLQRQLTAKEVEDYTLTGPDGGIKLSDLFGNKKDLIVNHYMGTHCPYCTLWADGFAGVNHHLENRAAFVLTSREPLPNLLKFKETRGWKFPVYSDSGSFTQDMGFYDGKKVLPGGSTFHKTDDGKILRIGRTVYGPGDSYCAVWHLFDLLKDGPNNWRPQFRYEN